MLKEICAKNKILTKIWNFLARSQITIVTVGNCQTNKNKIKWILKEPVHCNIGKVRFCPQCKFFNKNIIE